MPKTRSAWKNCSKLSPVLDFIKDLLSARSNADGHSAPSAQEELQLAAAALMLEVAAADHVLEEKELAAFSQIIAQHFSLDQEEVDFIYQHAREQQREAVSLYQFTQQVNAHADTQEKFNLIKAMWQIALADNHLDKYEEHLIRKVADLIYVSHTDFLVARNLARQEQSAQK